jgi:DHA1 family tetracycline resistance protein-like MFS transporter
MMTNTFYFFTHKDAPFQFAGAPFILGSFLMLLSTIIAFYTLHSNKKVIKPVDDFSIENEI